ncbi:hypothetical protein JCGZ_19933 [Jatropha curcas]|uniref:At1g61320/AtMIF1 LRR domain-containing protein n=1 Tax=Jatropha curcas TaxID=180498 RepID=A0A067K630_JATCU|nr:hypothetical protein JCGZ_19933 [Jatropha curcas]
MRDSLSLFIGEVGSVPSGLATFFNLKHLEFILDAETAFYDIRKNIPLPLACPLLQIFNLTILQQHFHFNNEERTTEEIPECRLTELKEVEFGGFQGTDTQLELALYLLKNAVALERMVISPAQRELRTFLTIASISGSLGTKDVKGSLNDCRERQHPEVHN